MQIALTEVIALLEQYGLDVVLAVLKAQQAGYDQGLKDARGVTNAYGLTEAQFITVLAYLHRGQLIQAIKYVREERRKTHPSWTSNELREAKELVERIAQDHRLLRWA